MQFIVLVITFVKIYLQKWS